MPLRYLPPMVKAYLRAAGLKLVPSERIKGLDKAWFIEMQCLLDHHLMSDGYAKKDVVMPGARKPSLKHFEHQVYRGYPFYNVFAQRSFTDGGPHTVPLSLGAEITAILKESERTFSMVKFAELMGKQGLFAHISGNTNLRSLTADIAVAAAFGAAKCSANAAFAYEHVDNAGSLLLASLVDVAGKIGPELSLDEDQRYMMESTFLSYKDQEERAGALVPYSRQECMTVAYIQDGDIRMQKSFNIYQPLYKPIKILLKLNADEEIVKVMHRYDHEALVAAIKLGEAYYNLMSGQESPQDERTALQEEFERAYQETIDVENRFNIIFKRAIKQEIARGNREAIELGESLDIDVKNAIIWFSSASCLAMGEYQSDLGNNIACEFTGTRGLILKIPQADGRITEKRFSLNQVLKRIPAYMIGAFNLLEHGQLNVDKIPEPLRKALTTVFINHLIELSDPSVESIKFKIPDASTIQTLSNAQVATAKVLTNEPVDPVEDEDEPGASFRPK